MISDKIKNIIAKSPINCILNIDDKNDLITSRFLRINVLTQNKGNIEFYLYGSAFNGKVFFNDVDSCYIELNENTKININLYDIYLNNQYCTDFEVLKFFHIKEIEFKPIASTY